MQPPASDPLIVLDEVTLRVGRAILFEHASWTLATGQHWAIIGANGSGKSTLANALFRKVAAVRGRILFFFNGPHRPRSYFDRGEVVRVSPEDHSGLAPGGYHQARWQSIERDSSPTVSDLLTGKSIEHISSFQVGPTRVNKEIYRARRERAVNLLGIDYLLDRRLLHLSNGEARKLLIARALMQSPKLLILDDPFCGLDNASRRSLGRVIDDLLAAQSPQILLVAPRLDEISPAITHVLCVAKGRIVDRGPRDETLRTPFARELSEPRKQLPSPPLLRVPSSPRNSTPVHSPLIEMQDVSVSYGGVDILRNISWTVRRGEHWALLGPNGAGKSSLLSLILADNPQSYVNRITLFGRRRGTGESIWEIKRQIGWISPELQLYYQRASACHRVVCSGFFDSVGLYRTCTPEQADLATEWMDTLGIAALTERPFGAVSVGQQRLVLLARALVKNPALLLLDEPCQGLDAPHRAHLIHLLDQLCRQTPVQLIYVTHHFDEKPAAITHVLELDEGRIRECGRLCSRTGRPPEI